ncbi:MAG: NAD(P)-binding domain-containing protein, partial [Proteobacteria bacterium]|nr:NAD(P)-binding domain-containing protein [Pseudomonadota bacterium]
MQALDQPIAVIGAGSWGTALALQFARSGREIRLWGRDAEQLAAINADGVNRRYLPDVPFPGNLRVEADLGTCLDGVKDILIAVPSHGLRETLIKVQPLLDSSARICWATKGFELSTGKLPHQVAGEVLGDDCAMAVLSGPTFAKEVGAGLPTAMTIAATDAEFANDLAAALSGDGAMMEVSPTDHEPLDRLLNTASVRKLLDCSDKS